MSICGKGIDTRSLPFLPIISPRLMYFDRLLFTLPRTIFRKRWWSRSIFCPTEGPLSKSINHETHERHEKKKRLPRLSFLCFFSSFRVFRVFRGSFSSALLLRLPTGEDAG